MNITVSFNDGVTVEIIPNEQILICSESDKSTAFNNALSNNDKVKIFNFINNRLENLLTGNEEVIL